MRCEKTSYERKHDAQRALSVIAEKAAQSFTESGIPIRAYKCNLCDLWHLTSKENPATKRVKLKHRDEWNDLMLKQQWREDLLGEKPFEKQIKKALSVIRHNINIQCEVLDEKFKHGERLLSEYYNREHNTILHRLDKVKI